MLLRAKDVPGLSVLVERLRRRSRATRCWPCPSLYGDVDVLEQARMALPALPGITRALDELARAGRARPGRRRR